MDFLTRIQTDEQKYTGFIDKCISDICSKKNIRLVLISGPSCSGKTVTTERLRLSLTTAGKDAHTISIDDFYKPIEQMPKNPDGSVDFESPECFDMVHLHKILAKLNNGESADIPKFDFALRKRSGIRSTITLRENSVAIIEGLHALNPIIYENFVPEENTYKIFLDCHSGTPSPMRYSRLIRRLARDYKYRSTSAEETFFLWDKVLKGEQLYIYPYMDRADTKINTKLGYEPHILRNRALTVLETLSPDSKYITFAKSITEYLLEISPESADNVPSDSLLQEFL